MRFHLMWGKILLRLFGTTLAFPPRWCCSCLPWEGAGGRRKKWPLGGLNKLLLKARKARSRCHWAGEEFPHWLHWGQSVQARSCLLQRDRRSPSCRCNGLPAAILPQQLWILRFPSPAARQWLFKRLFEKGRQQHLKGCGQNSLLAQCFVSNGKCSAQTGTRVGASEASLAWGLYWHSYFQASTALAAPYY